MQESYSVSSSRLGYRSEASNTITVAPYAGLFTIDALYPIGVETDATGFVVVGGCESLDMAVYDLQGRLYHAESNHIPGTHVSLPSGIYIMTSSFLNVPFKIIIP